MSTHRKITAILAMVLLLALAGCSLSGEQREPAKRLSAADFPTPVPTQPSPTPTPFPKQALELAAQLTGTETAVVSAADAPAPTATPAPTQPSPTATPIPPTPTPALPTGTVTSYGLNVRAGAGAGFDILEEVHLGDTVEILVTDAASGWVQVRTAAGTVGWVNPEFLDVTDGVSTAETSVQPAAVPVPAKNTTVGGRLLVQLKSGGDIMMLNRDGSNLHRVTSGIDPALSPDGERVAFTRWQGAEGTVYVINTDGSGERPVAGEIRLVKNPSWSPDSRKIAVNFQRGGTQDAHRECRSLINGRPNFNYWQAYDIETEIRIMNGQPVPFLCWWMPPDAHWQLRIITVADGSFEDMPAGQYAFSPAWDPANPWRVVSAVGDSGLVATDVNSGTAEPLTDDPNDRLPTFSPDGRFIAVTYRQDTHWDIHRLNADGSGRVRLTETPLWVTAVDEKPAWNNVSPVFSPDGSEIAFLTDRTGRWEVWVMGVDGSNQRPMFSDAVNDRLQIEYAFNDERVLGWGQ